MPEKETQLQTTETDITIETATADQYPPTDTANSITAENPVYTINTPETQHDTPLDIYNTITEKDEEEGNIKPPTSIPQINLTTPPNKTSAYTEPYQPPNLTQYTGTLTTADTQKDLLSLIIDQQRNPITATVGGPAPHNPLDEIYKSIMDTHKIDAEYLEKAEVSLLDTIEYLLNMDKDTEIYALRLTEEIYKDTISSELEREQTTRTIDAYLDFLKDAKVLEPKDYYNNTTKSMELTYTINPETKDTLDSAYKDTLALGANELPISEANELFIDCLQCKARDP